MTTEEIKLSDEEINEAKNSAVIFCMETRNNATADAMFKFVAQAAQKKIMEWGEDPCPGHRNKHEDTDTLMYLGKARWDCFVCRQTLRKGLE